jgi:putative transposase
MTDTLEPVAAAKEEVDQEQLAQRLLTQAKEQGVELVGPDGLLNQLTKRVPETALEEEMAEHLGYDKHDPVGRNFGNSRNGVRSKTVLTEIGPVEIDVPRDVDASFQPQIVVGHASTSVTEKVYRRELRPVLSRGATAMDALFGRRRAGRSG